MYHLTHPLIYKVITIPFSTVSLVPPPTPDVELVAVSSTSIKISWQSELCIVDCYRIAYKRNTGTMQQGPCPYEHSDTLKVEGGDMDFAIIITQLEEFSTYTVNVSAGNAAGYSTPSSGQATTWQAGNCLQNECNKTRQE